jgi:transcription antitermination factor NusG
MRFGAHCPTVPDKVLDELRATIGADQVHVIEDTIQPGQTVQIADGPLHGLQAVITKVMPERERLQVLLDFLGRQVTVELSAATVARLGDARLRVFESPRDAHEFQRPEKSGKIS